MTSATATVTTARDPGRVRPVPFVALVVGTALLAARPALLAGAARPALVLAVLFGALLVAGATLPIPVPAARASLGTRSVVLGVGVAGFALARVAVGGAPPFEATALLVAANTLAAVAEEAWFRRLCFGVLAPGGTAFAVCGSAVLFALVHVAIYGPWVLPLDLAVGLVLGWQRAATGSWGVPALTHAAANLLMVI
jgi:membrane protease YdiL (CAAX protease family)